jgi:hypothetical protein
VFKGLKLKNGDKIVVEQSRWKYMNLVSTNHDGVVLYLKKNEDPFPFTSQKEDRIVRPDFALIRNV